jgi:hypothetical protein
MVVELTIITVMGGATDPPNCTLSPAVKPVPVSTTRVPPVTGPLMISMESRVMMLGVAVSVALGLAVSVTVRVALGLAVSETVGVGDRVGL